MLLIGYNSKLSYLCLHFQCESAIDFFKTSKIGDRWCKLIKKLIRAVNKSILNSNSKWGLNLSKIIEHINTKKETSYGSSSITFFYVICTPSIFYRISMIWWKTYQHQRYMMTGRQRVSQFWTQTVSTDQRFSSHAVTFVS